MSDDTRDLAAFGYKQVLDRTLGSFSSFAAGFSYISVLTGLWRGGAGVLLDVAPGLSWSGGSRPLFCRAGRQLPAFGRRLPVVAKGQQPRRGLDGGLGFPVGLDH